MAGRVRRRAPCSARRSPSPAARSSARRAPRASSTGAGSRRSRSPACAARPGTLPAARAARRRGRLRGRDGARSSRRSPRAPRHGAAGGRRPGRGRRPRRRGCRPTRPRSPALIGKLEGALLEQMLPEGAGFAQGDDDARQPLGHDAPARAAARVHGPARARPVRPRAAVRRDRRPAGCCSSRRTSARPRRALDVPLGPFRTWIALHETTHAFEFEAHPWLRPYLAERLERQLSLFCDGRGVAGPRRHAGRSGAALRGDGPARRPALDGAPDVRRAARGCSARRRRS